MGSHSWFASQSMVRQWNVEILLSLSLSLRLTYELMKQDQWEIDFNRNSEWVLLVLSIQRQSCSLDWWDYWCIVRSHYSSPPLFDVWLDNKTLDRNLTQIIYLSYLQFRACLRDLQSVALNLSILNVRNGKWKCFSVSNKNLTENMNQ